jgi:hypothetical protein
MTLQLNSAFVPDHLRRRLEYHLRKAWIRTTLGPPSFRVRWVYDDPGKLVVGLELEGARLMRKALAAVGNDREALARALMDELEERLACFLRENHN